MRIAITRMFKTEQIVPESGTYTVTHSEHRLPNDVMLLKDQHFPRCAQCRVHVMYEPLHLVPNFDRRRHIIIHALTELNGSKLASAY